MTGRILIIATALAATLGARPAEGAPIYHARVVGCVGVIDTNSTGVFVTTGRLDCGASFSYGSGTAKSDEWGVGADLELVANTQGYLIFTANAEAYTEYMITGPTPTATVSLNLELTSGTGGGIPSDGTSIRTLSGGVTLLGYLNHSFSYQEVASSTTGLTSTSGPVTALCAPCSMETLTFTVPTNTWLPMSMALALTLEAGGSSVGQILALNTLFFPEDGPVFNVLNANPELYSARIAGLSVENNRVVGGDDLTPVPEPASLGLVGLGLAGLAARRRRRTRGPQVPA